MNIDTCFPFDVHLLVKNDTPLKKNINIYDYEDIKTIAEVIPHSPSS